MNGFENINEYYLPQLNSLIKRKFPDYYKEIHSTPKNKRVGLEVLTDEQVIDLHRKYIDEGDIEARDLLIYSQLGLVCYITKQFHYTNNGTTLSPDDILGFANEILIKIIDKYKPYYGKNEDEISNGEINKFPSFIQTWLRLNLHKELKNFGKEIRLPHNRIISIQKIKYYHSAFYNKFGRKPYDGEYIDLEDIRVTFNYSEKHVLLEKISKNSYEVIKTIPIQNEYNIISGNSPISEEDGEVFDLMEGEYGININDEKYLLTQSINKVLDTLDNREREFIELYYYKGEPKKNIPSLITPDYNCKNEIKRLNKTSLNHVDIYIEKKGKKYKFTYEIISNYHVENTECNSIDVEYFNPISHKYQNISTNYKSDKYKIKVLNADKIIVKHRGYKTSKEIDYNYDGKYLEFSVDYVYGDIFTSQTFLNKHEKLLNKLKKKLKTVKNIR